MTNNVCKKRENRTKQNGGGGEHHHQKRDTPSPKHSNEVNSAFIQISYFYPPFLICVLYILYINIYGVWPPGDGSGTPVGDFCRGRGRAALPRLELATGPAPPSQSTLDSVFFYNKRSVSIQAACLCWGRRSGLESAGEGCL